MKKYRYTIRLKNDRFGAAPTAPGALGAVEQKRAARVATMKTDVFTSPRENAERALGGLISSILRNNTYIRWSLLSSDISGEVCRAEFVAPSKSADLVSHLSAEATPDGSRLYVSIRHPQEVDAMNFLNV